AQVQPEDLRGDTLGQGTDSVRGATESGGPNRPVSDQAYTGSRKANESRPDAALGSEQEIDQQIAAARLKGDDTGTASGSPSAGQRSAEGRLSWMPDSRPTAGSEDISVTVPGAQASPSAVAVSSQEDDIAAAKMKGYEGDPCPECGQFTLVRNGACLKCLSCGGTTGCS
ncbi:MAG: hypothetical protein RIF32_06700, partial [Leptospirales bacterium]